MLVVSAGPYAGSLKLTVTDREPQEYDRVEAGERLTFSIADSAYYVDVLEIGDVARPGFHVG